MANEILHDLRVLDLTTTIAGPHCTRLLADLGATVVKIESPEGDLTRSRPPLREGVSSYFGQLNAGKKSVVLDLKNPAAVDIVKRLVRTSDVLVENFRPGVMQRLGLDYATLATVEPSLIYCAISGYGNVRGAQPTLPVLQRPGRCPAVCGRPRRARRRSPDRGRLQRSRDRSLPKERCARRSLKSQDHLASGGTDDRRRPCPLLS